MIDPTRAALDDLALDALAAGRAPENGDEVLGLLHALRTDLDDATAPPVAAPAVVPLRPRRSRRAALVGLSAAAGLIVGGLTAGAVVSADRPGQLFYAAHKAVLGDPDAAERVTKLLDDAAEALAEGDRREAARGLDRAAEALREVEDGAEREALADRMARLRGILAATTPVPSATPSETETPEPSETETESPDGDNSGSGSDSSGSGSDDRTDGDNSGSGSDNSGSGSDSSGKGSDDVLKTLDPDDSSGSGSGKD
ncbi:MAG TPA: hypothetical protein VNA20_08795 [Frankiaceae bacterium]|nr:hypothetical protein [Frankiaceae bacterium]